VPGERLLKGVIASLVTNFNADASLNEVGIRENVEFLLRAGVSGICVTGGTGEALALSEEEQRRVIDATMEAAGSSAVVVVGALDIDVDRAVRIGSHAADAGATALLVIPPYFVRPSDTHVDAYLRRIGDRSRLPVILFNSAWRAGILLSPERVVRLAEACPNISAIKECSGDLIQTTEILASAPSDFSVLQGLDQLVLPSLAVGASGALVTLASVMPSVFARLYASATAGDQTTARDLQYEIIGLAQVIYREANPVGVKRILDLLGRPGGLSRPPFGLISAENEANLERAVPRILAAETAAMADGVPR
jgi:4-hydroxy-tetrahydrodipicolinate synthase